MPAAASNSTSPVATEGAGIPWFIFTAGGRGYCLEADSVSKAVAKWKKLNAKEDPSDIVAVIRGPHGEITGPIITTPIYGVVVCMQYKSPSA
jgi:hypothetical protein